MPFRTIQFIIPGLLALLLTSTISGQRAKERAEPKAKSKERLDRFGDPLPEGARLRLGTERFRLSGWTRAPLAMFPKGDMIAATGGGYLMLFDAEKGYVVNRMRIDGKGIEDMALSPDGKRIVTVGNNWPGEGLPVGALTVWDSLALIELKTIPWKERTHPTKVIVFPGSKVAATAESAGVCLWDLEGSEELPRLPMTGCNSLCISPDGSLLAAADARGTIHLWEWKKKIDSRRIERPGTRGPVSLIFSPDGKTLAVGYDFADGVTLIDVATGKKKLTLPREATTYVTSMVFTPDGKQLITPDWANTRKRNRNGGVCVWDVEMGKQLRYLTTPGEGPNSVSLSRDGKRLACATESSIHVWDTESWKEISPDESGHRASVLSIATARNGLLLTGSRDHTARLWDIKDGRMIRQFAAQYWVSDGAFTPDGSVAAGVDNDDQILVWDTASGKTLFRLPGHDRYGNHTMIISDDGKRLLSFASDLYLRVIDLKNGKAIAEHSIQPEGIKIGDADLDGDRGREMQMIMMGGGRFTPDGKLLLLSTLEDLRVFETSSGKELRKLPGTRFMPFAISPDSRWLLTVQRPQGNAMEGINRKDETLRIVKIADGENVASMMFKDGGIRGVAASPDNKHFAVVVNLPDPMLHLCKIGDEKPFQSFKLNMPATSALTFTTDGKSVAVGITGGSVLIYDAPTGKEK